jgi:hypothetical protein
VYLSPNLCSTVCTCTLCATINNGFFFTACLLQSLAMSSAQQGPVGRTLPATAANPLRETADALRALGYPKDRIMAVAEQMLREHGRGALKWEAARRLECVLNYLKL